jgi:NAD(P)-dependent dehydrogenase (short-subunit alcohol dehydrogenase family)
VTVPDLPLAGRPAVVTGGASGIGRAACRLLASRGAAVAVLDTDEDGAAAVADEIGGRSWGVDVADADGLKGAVDAAATAFGGVTLLVNNAGTAGTMSPLAGWDLDEWEHLVAVNLGGIFHALRAAVPHLLRAEHAAVVNTASISGTRPAAGETPYAAAKAGVVALTASAALEYGGRIRVNAVAPGMIRTKLTEVLLDGFPDEVARYERTTPVGRIGAPEDVADVIGFLCSDEARFITGQTLVVDGGMTLHGAGVDGLFDRFFHPQRS